MDEFQLIEIMRRFRVLEDFIEHADVHLAGRQKHLKEKDILESEKIEELRSDIEMHLELCRDDMVTMQAAIRKKVRPL